MAEIFDPYHRWLGISPVEQPANHYRLLGLREFESDPDVIDSAADRQMAHVQTQKTGPHSALSQKLLNELAAARLCLLDPVRKSAYDQSLSATLADKAPTSPAPLPDRQTAQAVYAPTAPPLVAPAAAEPPIAVIAARKPVNAQRRPKSQRWLIPTLSIAVTVLLLAAAFYFLNAGTPEQVALPRQPVARQPNPPVNATRATPAGAPATASTIDNSVLPKSPATSALSADEKMAAARGMSSSPVQPVTPQEQTVAANSANSSNSAPSVPPQVTATAKSAGGARRSKALPAPAGETLASAKSTVNELFGAEIQAAKTPQEQHAVARRMFDRSFAPDLPVEVSHQLLERAAEVAASAGRYDVACEAIETMAGRFQTDAVRLKTTALEASDRFAKSASELRTLVDSWMNLAAEATTLDQYAAAVECYDRAVVVARKTSDQTLIARARDSAKDAAAVLASFDAAVAARDRLATHPGDPEAASTWGRFLCLAKHDWDAGLAVWSRGLDEMAHTARQDLARPPFSTEQTALGDRWWDGAEQETDELAKKRLRLRAAYWYRYARLGAPRGELARIQERIDQVEQSTSAFPLDQWIDLLKVIDLSKHRLQGQWESNGNVLATPGRGDHRLLVPLTASGSYEWEASLTLGPKDGPEMNFLFPVGSHNCALILFGWDGKTSGLDHVDGKRADNNETTVRKVGPQRGQRFKVLIQVEMAGDEAKVEVKLNSRLFTRWQGKASRLNLGKFFVMPQPSAFGVRSFNAPVILHSLRLRVNSGVIKVLE